MLWPLGGTPMISLNRILVPLDLSPNSESVLRYAVFYAEHWGAHVDVLHAIPEAWQLPEDEQNEAISQARERLGSLLESIGSAAAKRGGIEVTVGDPVTAILRAAPKYNLVVMGQPYGRGSEGTRGVAAAVASCVPCVFSPLPARRDVRSSAERTERNERSTDRVERSAATPVALAMGKGASAPASVRNSAH